MEKCMEKCGIPIRVTNNPQEPPVCFLKTWEAGRFFTGCRALFFPYGKRELIYSEYVV